MTLQQAINALMARDAVDIWIRPQGWRGCGMAYDLSADGKRMETVPTHRGGWENMTTLVDELCGEWDVVEVRTVLEERE